MGFEYFYGFVVGDSNQWQPNLFRNTTQIYAMKLFDGGYNKLRQRIFENHKRLGVIPKHSKLTPWPDEVLKPWDKLGAEEQKLFIRQV